MNAHKAIALCLDWRGARRPTGLAAGGTAEKRANESEAPLPLDHTYTYQIPMGFNFCGSDTR